MGRSRERHAGGRCRGRSRCALARPRAASSSLRNPERADSPIQRPRAEAGVHRPTADAPALEDLAGDALEARQRGILDMAGWGPQPLGDGERPGPSACFDRACVDLYTRQRAAAAQQGTKHSAAPRMRMRYLSSEVRRTLTHAHTHTHTHTKHPRLPARPRSPPCHR